MAEAAKVSLQFQTAKPRIIGDPPTSSSLPHPPQEQEVLAAVGSAADALSATGEALILKSLFVIHSDLDDVRRQKLRSKAHELWVQISTELYIFSEDQLCLAVHDSELLTDLRTIIRGRLLQELQREARAQQELKEKAVLQVTKAEAVTEEKREMEKRETPMRDKLLHALPLLQGSSVLPTRVRPTSITELFAAINLEFDINPKNLTIGKTEGDDDSTPALIVTFLLKMQWNSFQCISSEDNPLKLTNKEMRGDELGRAGVRIARGAHCPSACSLAPCLSLSLVVTIRVDISSMTSMCPFPHRSQFASSSTASTTRPPLTSRRLTASRRWKRTNL